MPARERGLAPPRRSNRAYPIQTGASDCPRDLHARDSPLAESAAGSAQCPVRPHQQRYLWEYRTPHRRQECPARRETLGSSREASRRRAAPGRPGVVGGGSLEQFPERLRRPSLAIAPIGSKVARTFSASASLRSVMRTRISSSGRRSFRRCPSTRTSFPSSPLRARAAPAGPTSIEQPPERALLMLGMLPPIARVGVQVGDRHPAELHNSIPEAHDRPPRPPVGPLRRPSAMNRARSAGATRMAFETPDVHDFAPLAEDVDRGGQETHESRCHLADRQEVVGPAVYDGQLRSQSSGGFLGPGSEWPPDTATLRNEEGSEAPVISGENSGGPVGFEPTAFGFVVRRGPCPLPQPSQPMGPETITELARKQPTDQRPKYDAAQDLANGPDVEPHGRTEADQCADDGPADKAQAELQKPIRSYSVVRERHRLTR